MSRIKNVILLDLVEDGIVFTEPVGMGSIDAVLKENNYNTYLFACYISQISYEKIVVFKPDLMAISIHPNTFNKVKKLTEKLSELLPDCIFTTGGYYATYNADHILTSSNISYIVYGEGEITTLELLNCLNQQGDLTKVNGIFCKEGDNIVKTPPRDFIENLDDLPFPSRDIMCQHNLIYAPIEGSRGCSNTCSFCSLQKFWTNEKTKLRFKSVKRTIDELEFIHKNYGINSFLFLDCSCENPHLNKDRMIETANEIINRKLSIAYFINARASIHKILDKELMNLLLKSGLSGVFIGIESFNEEDLQIFGKSSTHRDSIEILNILSEYPVIIDIGLINFHPYSTIEKIRTNITYIKKYNLGSRLYIFLKKLLPYKDTRIHSKIIQDGLSVNDGSYILNYKYADPRVEILYHFFADYVDGINSTNNVVLNLDYVFNNNNYYFQYYLTHYSELGNPQDKKTIEEINNYNQLLSEMKKNHNKDNCDCLHELLDLFDCGWNEDKAREICEKYISCDTCANSLEKLNRAKFKLLKRLEINRIINNNG